MVTMAVAEDMRVPLPIPLEVQEIEIVHIAGQTPKVTLKPKAEGALPPTVSLSNAVVDLLPRVADIRPFGACANAVSRTEARLTLTTQEVSGNFCGHELVLHAHERALDALSYGVLHVRGEASGHVILALTDQEARQREDHVALTTLAGRFDVRIPLEPAAKRLDLRYLASLVVVSHSPASTLVLDTVALEHVPPPLQQAARQGFWLWQYHAALAQSEEVLRTCRRVGCTRLAIQMPSVEDSDLLWQAYTQFLARAQAQGIEAFALDGYPEAIHDPGPLVEKINRLLTLTTGKGFTGVQLDIEPYILDGFMADESGFVAYLKVIERMKHLVQGKTRLSVVVPFWLTSQIVQGRPVGFAVMDQADEVAVMSYRTDVDELGALVVDILRYGDITQKAVWLAVETRALPVERHIVLRRETRRELADAYLDRATQRLFLSPPPEQAGLDWFRVHHRTTVHPERLTFAGQSRQVVQAAIAKVFATTPNPSLTGILIHDFDGFFSLSE